MVVQGEGGTGKSYVIKCLQNLLMKNLRVFAFTGSGSFLIQGTTIHRTFGLGLDLNDDSNIDGTKLENMIQRLEYVDYIVIDEYSMLGCKLLSLIDNRMR